MQQNQLKMLSEAGRMYSNTKIPHPFKTKQRFFSYDLPPIAVRQKIPKKYTTIDSNLRGKRDSFILRHTKQLVLNTDYSPTFDLVKPLSPKALIPKGKFERIIGDIRDEDYSVPLPENCDVRCRRANSSLSYYENLTQNQIQIDSEIESNMNSSANDLSKANTNDIKSLKKMKSTQATLLKKKSLQKIQLKLSEISRIGGDREKVKKGYSFDYGSGHQYLKEIEDRQPVPQVYDIEKCKQSIISRSFKEPCVHVKFPLFRSEIRSRYDRSDPVWHATIDSYNESLPHDKAYAFAKYSGRKMLQVKNKYPVRANMNLVHGKQIRTIQ